MCDLYNKKSILLDTKIGVNFTKVNERNEPDNV